jgi:hypothetical protein
MNCQARKVDRHYGTCVYDILYHVCQQVFSTATQVTAKEYGVSVEVTTLGTSLFVLVG